uniref:YecA family protein n=1 Tax=Rhodopseudomonas palustris (strain DX-1) TaxID=652103 RepID=E6VQE5_RHOPX
MPDLPPHLAQLEEDLADNGPDVMQVEELDGFIAALLVCPEMIKPGDWLPTVWGGDADEPAPFTDLDHANSIFALIMQHYNEVATTLAEHPERYRPLMPGIGTGDVVWEMWIDGFGAAVDMWPEHWERLQDADDTTRAAFDGLSGLVDISTMMVDISEDDREALAKTADDKITGWLIALNTWRIANAPSPRTIEWGPPTPPALPPTKRAKIGRNEPCPCGSGKKYKRCCGLN